MTRVVVGAATLVLTSAALLVLSCDASSRREASAAQPNYVEWPEVKEAMSREYSSMCNGSFVLPLAVNRAECIKAFRCNAIVMAACNRVVMAQPIPPPEFDGEEQAERLARAKLECARRMGNEAWVADAGCASVSEPIFPQPIHHGLGYNERDGG